MSDDQFRKWKRVHIPVEFGMKIVIVGDVVVDHHVYEGERLDPSSTEARGVTVVRELGGAKALSRLLEAIFLLASISMHSTGRCSALRS